MFIQQNNEQGVLVYSHGFQAGSILQILSKLAAAEMIVDTCDWPVSNSARSEI